MKKRYLIEVHSDGIDTYPNNFKCWVRITDCAVPDNERNKSFRRRGYGKYIGNFSPIWVRLNNQWKQLTELQREMV